jgi:hypothetical protein
VLTLSWSVTQTKSVRAEFEKHELNNVVIKHGNVCKDGFGDAIDVEGGTYQIGPYGWALIYSIS